MEITDGEKILKQFGENLKKIRNSRGLSIRQLSDLADMNLGNLSDLELGKKSPGLLTVYALASALGVAPKDLLP